MMDRPPSTTTIRLMTPPGVNVLVTVGCGARGLQQALFDLFVAAALVRATEERNTGHHIAL
jgi:hypothetical protein